MSDQNNIVIYNLLQLVAIPNPVPIQQTEAVKPKPPTVAVKQSSTAGKLQVIFKSQASCI